MQVENELDLLIYSEWLDVSGLMVTEDGDDRTHEDLVNEFIASGGYARVVV